MSITLELPPELENRLRVEAVSRGINLESLVLEALREHYEVPLLPGGRRELVRSLRGRVKGPHPTVDEFLAERSAEAPR